MSKKLMMLSAMAGMLAASANDVYGLRSYRLTAQEKIGARIAKRRNASRANIFVKTVMAGVAVEYMLVWTIVYIRWLWLAASIRKEISS